MAQALHPKGSAVLLPNEAPVDYTKTVEIESLRFEVTGPSGKVNLTQLVEQHQAELRTRHGARGAYLRLREPELLGNHNLSVLIKMKLDFEDEELPDRTSIVSLQDLAEAERISIDSHQQLQNTAKSLFEQVTESINVAAPEHFGPWVTARVTKSAIEAIATDNAIELIDLHEIGADVPFDFDARAHDFLPFEEGVRITIPTGDHPGCRGLGVTICIDEPKVRPDLAEIGLTLGDVPIQDLDLPVGHHPTGSVAMCQHRAFDKLSGHAPEARIIFANATEIGDPLIPRLAWARGHAANVISMSWHETLELRTPFLRRRDHLLDYYSKRYPWPSCFVSAGNALDPPDPDKLRTAGGRGFHLISVGATSYKSDQFPESTPRCRSRKRSNSAWKNSDSLFGDRELPDLCAPGIPFAFGDYEPAGFHSTSAAAPIAASIGALIMSANERLKIWPEAIRAIILSTADEQLLGDNLKWGKGDGRDGVGLVNADLACRIAKVFRRISTDRGSGFHHYGKIGSEDFGEGAFLKQTWAITPNGDRTRVLFTWNQSDFLHESYPSADLDLFVIDENQKIDDRYSASWDNNYELVEFESTPGATYTVRVAAARLPSDFSSYYGFAWCSTSPEDRCPEPQV